MRRAFEQAGVANPLYAVEDGQEAIDYLSGTGQYADRQRYPLPCLLVTDLKMPRLDGFDLLVWLQARPEFQDLPRLVISSSCHERDLRRCLELGATGLWVKPGDFGELIEIVRGWQQSYIARYCGGKGPGVADGAQAQPAVR